MAADQNTKKTTDRQVNTFLCVHFCVQMQTGLQTKCSKSYKIIKNDFFGLHSNAQVWKVCPIAHSEKLLQIIFIFAIIYRADDSTWAFKVLCNAAVFINVKR